MVSTRLAERLAQGRLVEGPEYADEDELRSFCGAKLHRYQVPELIEFVDDLPKTATGKIERYKLRAPM